MATHQPGHYLPGTPHRYRDTEDLPELPKQRIPWAMLAGALLAFLLLVGVVVGFLRAASAPRPIIESPDFEAPGEVQPRPR